MSTSRVSVGAACVVLLLSTTALAQVAHVGNSADDQFLLCARTVFQKPVLRDSVQPWPTDTIRCPQARAALIADLTAHGFSVFESSHGILIVSTRRMRGQIGSPVRWTAIDVQVETKRNPSPGSVPVSADLQKQVTAAVLNSARLVPIAVGSEPGLDRKTLGVSLVLNLDAPVLTRGTSSIVVFEGGESDPTGRLVYGEVHDGVFRIVWDSALMSNMLLLSWDYTDLDGDGVKEILIHSFVAPYYETLLAFDIHGHELIRDVDCLPHLDFGFDETNGTCPILGEEIELTEPIDGKVDVLAVTRFDKEPRRYRLESGVYHLITSSR